MAKIMLVEDDTNLSEIYQARLTAEGYDIVSAHDGEEALAIAAKEKPDLIVSDVMMPKISGFEMLDILRNTEGLKEAKVIMLTALGQADDKTRAEGLGADRYLVKSQVTLEDIVKAAQELLNPTPAPAAGAPAASSAAPVAAAAPAPVPMPMAAPPAATPVPVVSAPAAVAPAPAPAPAMPVAAPPVAPTPVPDPTPVVAPVPTVPVAAPVMPVPTPMAAPAPAPAMPVAAPPVAPTPVPDPVVAMAPVTDPATAVDNKLVADAVENLIEGVAGKPAPAPIAAVPTEAVTPPALADPVDASTPAPDPIDSSDTDIDDDLSSEGKGSHKKIIKPITDGSVVPRPSLESLLADEERKNPSSTGAAPATSEQPAHAPVTDVPHQPGHIITPSAAESLNNGSGIDPNSIAL